MEHRFSIQSRMKFHTVKSSIDFYRQISECWHGAQTLLSISPPASPAKSAGTDIFSPSLPSHQRSAPRAYTVIQTSKTHPLAAEGKAGSILMPCVKHLISLSAFTTSGISAKQIRASKLRTLSAASSTLTLKRLIAAKFPLAMSADQASSSTNTQTKLQARS